MNWFERHLNWTWVFAYLIWWYLNGTAIYEESATFNVLSLVALIFLTIVSGWVIKQKERSLWWLLLAPVFSPLWLKNKKWDSIEHFKSTQRKWGIAGAAVFVVGVIIFIVVLIPSSAPSTTPPVVFTIIESPSSPSHGIPLTDLRMNTQYWNTGHEKEALRIFENKTYDKADEAWMADELAELYQTMSSINKEYHRTHTYIEGEFDCNDMAVDLWNMLHKAGIASLIVFGNLDLDNESFAESDHTWLVVPYQYYPHFFSVEPTNGEVYLSEDKQYWEGYYYTSPSNLRADIRERW